ncbi:hypothetical protein BGY98DRAFT_1104417, partial [Russula aff. rugulosa BPL654]
MSPSQSQEKEKGKGKVAGFRPIERLYVKGKGQQDLANAINEGENTKDYFGSKITDLRKLKDDLSLGYMKMSIVRPPIGAHWGKFNNRTLTEKWIVQLCKDFLASSVDNCSDVHAMDVALDPIPELKFTPAGAAAIRKNNLWMLSGNHRRVAVLRHIEELRKQLIDANEQIEDVIKDKTETQLANLEDKPKEKLAYFQNIVKVLEPVIKASSWWVVRVIDRATIEANHKNESMALFRFISRNITYSSHHASEEEKLQEIVDQMKDSLEEDLRKRKEHSLQHEDFENKYPRFKETAKLKADLYKQTSIGYRQICCVPSFALGLVMASRVQNHFTHAPWFRLGILKDMVDVYGTFISKFIVQSVEYLERIANEREPPLKYAEVEKIKEAFLDLEKEDDATELQESLKGMEKAFEKTGDLSSWSPELMHDIDQAFVKSYMDENGEAAAHLFFPDSAKNINAFAAYCTNVDKALRKHAKTAPPYAHEYFIYYSIWQMRGWRFPVPLGTASVVGVLNKMLKQVKNGFSEVISWIATSISWSSHINSKVFLIRDEFDAMVETAAADPLLARTRVVGLRRKMFEIFFSHLTTTIAEIEVCLSKLKVPRNKVPKKVAGFLKLTDRISKSLVSAHDAPERPAKDADEYEKFLVSLGCKLPNFLHNWATNYEVMDVEFQTSHRMSPRRGERILVMSGLSWNTKTHHKQRDYLPAQAAITLETVLVEYYREDLLRECNGAPALRKEMQDYFLSVTSPYHEDVPNKPGLTRRIKAWEFPDKYDTPESNDSTSGGRKYDANMMKKELDQANPPPKRKTKEVIAQSKIEGLLDNKYLWASIAYFNLKRLEHGESKRGGQTTKGPFNAEQAKLLGYDDWVFKLATDKENAAGPSASAARRPRSLKRGNEKSKDKGASACWRIAFCDFYCLVFPYVPSVAGIIGGGGLIDTGAMSTEEDEVEQDIETEASSCPEESTSGVTDEEDNEEDDDDKGKGKGKDD